MTYKKDNNPGRDSRTIAFGEGHVRFNKKERDLLDECVRIIQKLGAKDTGFKKNEKINRRSVGHHAVVLLRHQLEDIENKNEDKPTEGC